MRTINNTICKTFNVRYTDCFYREHTNIVSILGFFNEIAQEAGYYYDQEKNILKDESLAWIILNWDIDINRYPQYREQVKVCTIARSIDRFIAFRDFKLYNNTHQLLARGKSKWILLNLDKRKPAIARDYMYDLYGVSETKPPFEINKPKELKEHTQAPPLFRVRKRDVDGYEHVNNTVYAYWINESIPDDITAKKHLKNLRLYYKRETTYPGDILIHNKLVDHEQIIHRIDQTDGKNLVYGESVWEPN